MKRMTGYYVPRTLSDTNAFTAQFERKRTPHNLDAENPIHFPARGEGFAYDLWQDILKSLKRYPSVLEIFDNDKQMVAKRVVHSRDHLDICFDWFWENSNYLTLGYRFTPKTRAARPLRGLR